MGLCSGHGHSVVIRELSLYPQSLLAKLTVFHILAITASTIIIMQTSPHTEHCHCYLVTTEVSEFFYTTPWLLPVSKHGKTLSVSIY